MPPADAAKIPCPTPQHLQVELSALSDVLALGETEDSWDKMERAIIRFTAVVRGGGYKHHTMFMAAMGNKGMGLDLVDCMGSDRGRLSGATTDLLQTFAPRLGASFQPLVQLYIPNVVKLLGRPNKVYLKRAEKCLSLIISNCHLPSILPHLRTGVDDRSETCRRLSATAIDLATQEWEVSRWHERDLEVLEQCIKKMATNKDAQVRKTGKVVWASFQDIWPERVDDFTAPLTPTSRRYLDLPPAEGGPSRSKVARPALGRTGGLAPSHPSQPPQHAASSSKLNSSTGSDRGIRPPRTQVSALGGGAVRARIPSEQVETRTASDNGRSRAALDPRQDQAARLTRSGSRVLSHASSSSSLGSSSGTGTAKAALLSKPTRPALQSTASEPSAPSSRRFAPPHRPTRPAEPLEESPRLSAATRSGSAQSYNSVSSAGSSMKQLPPRRVATTPASASSDVPSTSRSASDPTPPVIDTAISPAEATRSASRVRERVTYIEKLESESGTTPKRPTPTRELQLAAGIPLPQDTPVPARQGSQSSQYSPSLSMLLGKHSKFPADLDCTLADLSVDGNTTDSPLPQRVAGLPTSSLPPANGTGLPGVSPDAGLPSSLRSSPVSQLINKFSPGTGTPLRSSLLPEETTTPTTNSVPLPDERRISPLPRRIAESTVDDMVPVEQEQTPRSSKKRKVEEQSTAEPIPQPRRSLIDATPTPAPAQFNPDAPRLMDPTPVKSKDQPLISFFDYNDSPAGAAPFRFGAAPTRPRASIFSALLGLAMDAPSSSTVEPAVEEEEEEEDVGDETVRIEAPRVEASLVDAPHVETPAETPSQALVDLTDDDSEGEGDVTAIFQPTRAVEEVEEVEEAEPVELLSPVANTVAKPKAAEAEPEPATSPEPQTVQPVAVPTVSPVKLFEAEPVKPAELVCLDLAEKTVQEEPKATPPNVETEPLHHSPSPPPLPEDAVAPPTPLPEVLAEFDTLSEAEPEEEETPEELVATPAAEPVVASAEPAEVTATPAKKSTPVKEATPEPLVDTSDPMVEIVPDEKRSPLEEMKEMFEEPPAVDLLTISTGSPAPAPAESEPEPLAAVDAPTAARPPSAAERRPKSTTTRRREPVEKKSFRPVSRMQEAKGAPAPPRVARGVTAPTAASAARGAATAAAAPAPAPAKPARQARAPQIVSAPKPAPARTASASQASTVSKATSNLFKPTAATAARAAANAASAADSLDVKEKETAKVTKPASRPPSRPASSLGQAHPASRATTSTATSAAPAPAPAPTRPARSAMGSTAASRAREAALPPIKRQRLKLTAPQESFRPGRTNKSKAAILGAGSGPAARRAPRVVRGKKEVVETFPLPGPGLRASLGAAGEASESGKEATEAAPESAGKGSEAGKDERTAVGKGLPGKESSPESVKSAGKGTSEAKPVAIPAANHLEVPSDVDCHTPRTPSALSPESFNKCLSPASSRHTSYTSHSDYSFSSRPSPSKLKVAAARALDPVLTPTHSANVSAAMSSGQATLVAPVADSPAVVHARRVSGIPASLKKTMEEARRQQISSSPPSTGSRTMLGLVSEDEDLATPRRRQSRRTRASVRELHIDAAAANEEADYEAEDESLSVIRHDVSTPTGKAASLLRKYDDERRVLTPRDANASE